MLEPPGPAHEVVHDLRRALLESAGARTTVHGVLVQVYGLGVLILGAAGAGKSLLALELVDRGHRLVADDAVDMARPAAGVLLGASPPLLRGLIAVRGPGVLDVARSYGRGAPARQRVDLAVRLGRRGAAVEPGRRRVLRLLGEPLPLLALPLVHNLPLLIEAACRDHWLRLAGFDAGAAFSARQRQRMKQRP